MVTSVSASAGLRALVGTGPSRMRRWARRWRQIRRLAASGVIDRAYYQVQTGRPFRSAAAVAAHYLSGGAAAGLSVHPLFEPELVAAKLDRSIDPLLAYLTTRSLSENVSPHPLFDLNEARQAISEPGNGSGVWQAWVRAATPDAVVPVPLGTEPLTWGELRERLLRAAARWRESDDAVSSMARPRRPGTTSVIVPVAPTLAGTLKWSGLLDAGGCDLVVVGVGDRGQFCCLSALASGRPITVLRSGGDGAGAWNRGAAASSGEVLVFVAPRTRLPAEALPALRSALESPVAALAQPLNENPDMTVYSAGAHFPSDDVVPSPLFSGHAVEDVLRSTETRIPAAYSGVLAVSAADFEALGGFETALSFDLAGVDLSLRAARDRIGGTVLVREARCTVREPRPNDSATEASVRLLRSRWRPPLPGAATILADAGFVVSGFHVRSREEAIAVREPELVRSRTGLEALPSLRWTIDTAVTAGRWAQAWGDWHFARSLADALGRLDQHVAVDTRQARPRATRRFDDVVLTLRGLDAVHPRSGPVNLLWVISHADDVTAPEVAAYDAAFAASVAWSRDRSQEWGVDVRPLLQCTDATRFSPDRATRPRGDQIVFVGNARRGGARPLVESVLRAGVSLDLYGTGWEGEALRHLRADSVSNAEVARIYAEAGVVLNDHWADMRASGFISNRAFDAVACGARVLSDPVEGMEGLFDGSVVCCEPGAEVERILAEPFARHWPSDETRRATAARVAAEHSFDQRALTLLARAVELLRQRS